MIDYKNVTLSVLNHSGVKVGELYSPTLKRIGQAYDISLTHEGNGWKELSFSIPKRVEGGANPQVEYLVNEYIIQVDDGSYKDRFIITEPNLTHNKGSMTINAKCNHISSKLRTKKLYLMFDDTNGIGKCHEIAGIILQGTGWTLGTVDTFLEPDGVTEKIRTLKTSGKEGAYQLLTKLCELFNARPVFNGDTQTVDLVAFAPYSFSSGSSYPTMENPQTLIELNYSKALEGVTRNLSTDNLVTRLFVEGEYGDNGYVGIESVNPTGLNFILNFDYLGSTGQFTAAHQTIVDEYLTSIGTARNALKNASLTISEHQTELMKLWGTADYSLYDITEVVSSTVFNVAHVTSLGATVEMVVGQAARVLYSDGTHLETKVANTTAFNVTIANPVAGGKTPVSILIYRALASGKIGGKESAAEAAQEMYQNLIDRIGDNLVLDSGTIKSSTEYMVSQYTLSENWVVGKQYTLSIWGSVNSGNVFRVYRDDGYTVLPNPTYDTRRRCWIVTFTCPTTSQTAKNILRVYNSPQATATQGSVNRIKLEYGATPSFWSEAEDSSSRELVQECLDKIDFLFKGNAEEEGIYTLTAQAVSHARLLETARGDLAAKSQIVSAIEAQFVEDMGDLLSDGYWQDNNYVVGQEASLFSDAVDVLAVMSKPVASYNITIHNIKGMDETPLIKASINSPVHIIDDDAGINEWGYVEQAVYVLDNPPKNTIRVGTKESKFAGQSFAQIMSQIAETARDVRSMQDVYKRASAIDKRGNISTTTLQGIIDTEATRLLSATSNWYTDERGNIVFVSHDGLSAMMLTGEGFMIAQSKTPTGGWNWRTFGTGRGFTADEINSGTINAGLIKILGTDQFYWNADNIHIFDPSNPMRQIRIGRYDGENYGIGFTEDDGSTWETSLGFDGIHLGSLTINDVNSQLKQVKVEIVSSEGTVYNEDIMPSLPTVLTARIIVGTIPQTDLTGYNFQWQKSINGGTIWTNISGATASTYQYNATISEQVRCVVTT